MTLPPLPAVSESDWQDNSGVVVGSLCSGYEGLGLGLGPVVRHAWFVENDPAPSKILAAHYPGVPNYGDLKTLDYAALAPVDILTAGYPCQPFSDAGLRKGADDPRHLWPYVADVVRALRPGIVLLENVRGHVRRGLDSVIADLAALGYDASWGLVRASDAGAPHQRARIFVVATDAENQRHEWPRPTRLGRHGSTDERDVATHPASDAGRLGHRNDVPAGRGTLGCEPPAGGGRTSADTDHADGWSGDEERAQVGGAAAARRGEDAQRPAADGAWGVYEPAIRRWERISGRAAPWATEPRGRGGAERLSPRFVEWMMGLPAGWVTDCDLGANEQLKALGNGVVPQQAALAVRLLGRNALAAEVAA